MACVGVGTEEVRYSFVAVSDSAKGAVMDLGPLLFARVWARGSSTLCGSALMLAANCGPDGAEEEGAVGSMREREREDEREETTLRTRSRRLPIDDDGANRCSLSSKPRVLLEVGVGVGIPLSDSEGVELFRLGKAAGRLRLPRSLGAEMLFCSL